MSSVLVINSSASREASVSKLLVDEAVAALRSEDPAVRVVIRDVGEAPVPHLTPDAAAGLRREEPDNDAQRQARALSDELIREIEDAETIVIGAPMYNFGIPSTLKSWFDYVLRPGRTFRYSEAGPEGILKGKRAIVVIARGGFYSAGAAKPMDSQEPHIRTMLGFMGITDVDFVRAEKLGFGPEARDAAILGAKADIARLNQADLRQAA